MDLLKTTIAAYKGQQHHTHEHDSSSVPDVPHETCKEEATKAKEQTAGHAFVSHCEGGILRRCRPAHGRNRTSERRQGDKKREYFPLWPPCKDQPRPAGVQGSHVRNKGVIAGSWRPSFATPPLPIGKTTVREYTSWKPTQEGIDTCLAADTPGETPEDSCPCQEQPLMILESHLPAARCTAEERPRRVESVELLRTRGPT